MLFTKIQPQFLGSGGEDLFSVFTIYGHGGHLVQWCENIEQIVNTSSTKGSM